MDKLKAVAVSLDDIIFENRNKAYGAYVLRKSYSSRLFFSAIMAMSATLPLFLFRQPTKLTSPLVFVQDSTDIDSVFKFVEMNIIPEKERPTIKLPPASSIVSTVVSSTTIGPDDAKHADTTTSFVSSNPNPNPNTNVGDTSGTGSVADTSGHGSGNETATWMPDEMPRFPGGDEAMIRFVLKNIRYPEFALNIGKEGTVVLNFVVGKTGEIRDITVMSGIGFGCDEEAIRVVKKMPAWIPGRFRGGPVSVSYNLPVRYKIMQSN